MKKTAIGLQTCPPSIFKIHFQNAIGPRWQFHRNLFPPVLLWAHLSKIKVRRGEEVREVSRADRGNWQEQSIPKRISVVSILGTDLLILPISFPSWPFRWGNRGSKRSSDQIIRQLNPKFFGSQPTMIPNTTCSFIIGQEIYLQRIHVLLVHQFNFLL